LTQTFKNLELLVIDDASDDDTVRILQSLNDPRIRLIESRERLYITGALNLGMAQASSPYMARMDGDDIALPNRLQLQFDYLESQPDTGLCGGLARAFGTRQGLFFRPPLSHGEIQSYALFDSPFIHPTIMLRRDLFLRHNLTFDPDYLHCEDYELWSRAVRLFPCANLNRVVLRYRIHPGGVTQSAWSAMDANAARVASRELAGLNLKTDATTVQFHRNVGRGRGFPISCRQDLVKVESWLQTLVTANDNVRRYPERDFRRVVSGIWYGACYHAGALGPWMLARYVSSPHRRARLTSPQEWAALLWSTMKRTPL
jgi:glycosyltransferase involved in cell wall biosynthesis